MAQHYSWEIRVDDHTVQLAAVSSGESIVVNAWALARPGVRRRFIGEVKLSTTYAPLLQTALDALLGQLVLPALQPARPVAEADGYVRLVERILKPRGDPQVAPSTDGGGGADLAARPRSGDAQAGRLEALRKSYSSAYLPWMPSEEGALINHFDEGTSIAEIARLLGRQPGGIRSRLQKLGRIDR